MGLIRTRIRPLIRLLSGGALALSLVAAGSGCQLVGLASVMAESYKRTGTHEVKALYTGLEGKSFAVIVVADRALMSEHPRLQSEVTTIVSERLRVEAGAAGYVPPQTVLTFQTEQPRWKAMSPSDLAEELGVQRLVFVEITDFRLREAGNAYIWNGLATAQVGVLEADGAIDDEFVYRKSVQVRFPDRDGFGPDDYSADHVMMRLRTRMCDRIVWLFHDHQEPYYPDY